MKALSVFVGSLLFLYIIIRVGVFFLNRHNESWQRQEEQIAVREFSSDGKVYEDILRRWTRLFPDKCGGPAPSPGQVTVESITTLPGGRFSLGVNLDLSPDLTADDVAKRLGADPQDVRSLGELLRTVNSRDVLQSGEAVKLISLRNDTHGILHVDSTCKGAAQYGNLTYSVDNPGSYLRLRDLGGGWHYFVEQR